MEQKRDSVKEDASLANPANPANPADAENPVNPADADVNPEEEVCHVDQRKVDVDVALVPVAALDVAVAPEKEGAAALDAVPALADAADVKF